MSPDDLFPEIVWSTPITVEELRVNRKPAPKQQGLYVFTNHTGPLEPGRGILYIGKTEDDPQGLWSRLRGYVRDPAKVNVMSSKHPGEIGSAVKHAGRANLLMEIASKYRDGNTASGVYVRWFVCPSPTDREEALIRHYKPAFNTQHNAR